MTDRFLMNYDTKPYTYDNVEAIERLKLGDSQAWREFVSFYSRRLRYDILVSLMKRSLPDESLHDIEQDTWLTAANKMSSFMWRGDGSLYNWLRAISLNHILGRIPRIKQRRSLLAIEEIESVDCEGNFALDHFLFANGLTQGSTENEVIQREERAELLRLIFDQEDPLYIEIAIEVWVDNRKPHELAEIYGIRPRTISQRLWRMKSRLDALGLESDQRILLSG